jgi:hypothetical protein
MKESHVERKFVEHCKERGWLAPKFTSPGQRGYPDRIVFPPGAAAVMVEVKAANGRPTRLQETRHEQLRARQHAVYVLQGVDDIARIIAEIEKRVAGVPGADSYLGP